MSDRGVRRRVTTAAVSPNAANSGSSWRLTLECGHTVWRHRQAGKQNRNWKHYPAPKFVYCKRCIHPPEPEDSNV